MADHQTPVITPAEESQEGGVAVQTRPAPPARKVDRLPLWNVLLHNDEKNSMVDVVVAIRQLTGLPTPRATQCMLEAHTRGLSLLLTTHRERAELLHEQFASKKLTVTIEPER